jgi:capsule polysaccharide modification protein KpsS
MKKRIIRLARYLFLFAAVAFIFLLAYPQVLFAHEVSYKNFNVYSREPISQDVYAMLDKVEVQLSASQLNNTAVKPKIFLTNSQKLYSLLSLYIGGNSFGKGFPLLPTSNVFINEADISRDLVFRKAPANNQRSLSGVISHEITHLHIRSRFGYVQNVTLPTWKKEGYCEYVAGGSTLDYETGVRLWKANPNNDTGYQYFKYYLLVKHLLEKEGLTVEEFLNRDIDRAQLEAKVLNTL